MTKQDFILESLKGGPGLRAYVYQSDVYCEECAEDIIKEIAPTIAPMLSGTDDPLFSDGDTCPQPCFFPESDTRQYCGKCGDYLYGEEE